MFSHIVPPLLLILKITFSGRALPFEAMSPVNSPGRVASLEMLCTEGQEAWVLGLTQPLIFLGASGRPLLPRPQVSQL